MFHAWNKTYEARWKEGSIKELQFKAAILSKGIVKWEKCNANG